jgi:hypothetical protein
MKKALNCAKDLGIMARASKQDMSITIWDITIG